MTGHLAYCLSRKRGELSLWKLEQGVLSNTWICHPSIYFCFEALLDNIFFSFKTTEHMWTLNDMKPVVSKLKWRCWFGKPIFTSCTWKKIFALRNYSTMHVLFHGEPPYKWHKLFSKYLRKTQKPSWQLNSGPSRAPQYSTKKNAHLFRYHTEETMKAHQPEVASGQTFLCGV